MGVQDRALGRLKDASPAQLKYLEGLLIDCGFSSIVQRNAYLTRETNRDIVFLSDVKSHEASRLIDELKERKNRGRVERDDRDEPSDSD